MIARWVLTANVFLIAFNAVLMISNALLLRRIKVAHYGLDDATERLRLQIVEHREHVLEGLRD